MPTNIPQIIEEKNLSHAWGRVLLHVLDNSKRNLAPLVVSVTGFQDGLPVEDIEIRQRLDELLGSRENKFSCKVTALTIFPYDAWLRGGCLPIREFSEWYIKNYFPRLQALDGHNVRGTYFERMIRFQGSKKSRNGPAELGVKNQLEHLISIWNRDPQKRPRHSALQISIFDPIQDHTGGVMLGFPCLQQISLSYDDNHQLAINAYYPTQYIVDRAYGNYLGLCHLGYFIAREMGLKFARLNCFVGLPELGNDLNKEEMAPLADLIRSRLINRDDA